MAQTKTKPKASKATAKKSAPAKKAKASDKAAEQPKAPAKVLEENTFAQFTGYRSEVDADERVFEEGETVFIVEVEEADDGVLYSAIKADDVAEYQENGDENVEGGQVAPQELKELKGTALTKAHEQFMPVALVGKLSDMFDEEDDAVAVAKRLFENVQENYFYLGGALARVLQGGDYLKENGGDYEGEEAFNDFCQDNFAFKASKGRQLARIYQTFSQLEDFDPEKLHGIGWSLVSRAEKYVTPENVDNVLETLKEDGVKQRNVESVLTEKFSSDDGKTASGRAGAGSRGGSQQIVKQTLSFRLEQDSYDTVRLALDACKKQYGIESDELAAERIFTEWAQDHVETATAQKRIATKANKAAKARAAADKGSTSNSTKKPAGKKKAA